MLGETVDPTDEPRALLRESGHLEQTGRHTDTHGISWCDRVDEESLKSHEIRPLLATTAPDALTVAGAREVVVKMQGDCEVALASMGDPMVGLIQQMGVKDPERAQVMVREVILPVMTAHYDELLDIQARSFAGVLGANDLKAVSAFYDTPAGKALAKAQPQLGQALLTGMTQWMDALASEIQSKLVQAIKAHGWDKAAPTAR